MKWISDLNYRKSVTGWEIHGIEILTWAWAFFIYLSQNLVYCIKGWGQKYFHTANVHFITPWFE